MYFNDLSLVLMMFGRVQYKQWDLSIAWFQFWGQQAIGDIESPLEKVIVIRVEQKQAWWILFETFLESWKFKFGNSIPTSKNYTKAKRVESLEKCFQKMEVNIICANFVFMDFINPFGVSGDFIGCINLFKYFRNITCVKMKIYVCVCIICTRARENKK